MTVAEHLRASKGAHDAYRQATGKADKSGKLTQAPNYVVAEEHVARALEHRLAAHEADPEHTDSEWGNWQHRQHEALVAFYERYATLA